MHNKNHTVYLNEIVQADKDGFAIVNFDQEDIALHDHNFFELTYITGGTAVHTLNGIKAVLKKGDYFLVDYGSVHGYSKCENFTLINCIFRPEIIDDTLEGCQSVERMLQVCLIRYYKNHAGYNVANRTFFDEDGEVLKILLEMQQECEQKEIGYEQIFRGRLKEIILKTMRKCIVKQDFEHVTKNAMVRDLVRFIKKNYLEKSVLQMFCNEKHYSNAYVSRTFHEETGMTASDYLKRVRMETACTLLSGSDLLIGEIANRCGYEDMAHFRKVFGEHFHMSPREYRNLKR